jgi:L-cystine transport system permease protein
MNFSFSFMLIALRAASAKIPVTLMIAAYPLVLGMILGLLIALARFFQTPVLSFIFRWLVTIFKGIPVVLLLLVIYVGAAMSYDSIMQSLGLNFTFKDLNKVIIAIFSLTVYSSIALSEVFRGALASVKKGQFDAGYAMGLTKVQILRRIVLPQAIPVSLPMMCNILIGLTKAAALASMVAVVDVMNAAVISATTNYRFLEAYCAAAIIYWVICIVIERVFFALEKISGRTIRDVNV